MQDSNTPAPADSVNAQPIPQGKDRDQRREDILNAARGFFVEKGYESTTMAEIADAASLAVGTLYKFFKDKHDLYQTLVAEMVREFEQHSLVALSEPPGDEIAQLHRYIDVGSELFVKHLPIIRVYYSETGAAFLFATAGLEGEAFLSHERMVVALEETFRRGIGNGVFIDLEPAALAMALEGVHNAFLTALVRDPQCYTPEQIASFTKRIFFDTVLRK